VTATDTLDIGQGVHNFLLAIDVDNQVGVTVTDVPDLGQCVHNLLLGWGTRTVHDSGWKSRRQGADKAPSRG